MGIRMKVAVGYGLDLTGLNTEFISDFANMECADLFSAFVAGALASAEERDDLQDKMSIGFAMGTPHHQPEEPPPSAFYQVTEYDREFAFADKLLLYPLGYKKSWSRYGNHLDAFIHEAYQKPGEFDLVSEWREKPGTLYPFSGSLMRANPEKPLGIETYWVPCYMDRPEHRDAAPAPPMHLWHMIRHLELTRTDAETTAAFLSLRPTFMRWWS
ncbi:hypothetical protein [Paracoccus litorisediminis]|uniref:Uncharacterized protein n=1 Tax=Paracoccus litorisediminis TaxID=2006130 RepID=A0A844HUH9_9RHOB|nr:hypothetical protein [Paracoccus litorisediminis]MTH61162.1 hypothetical protein [Paracoccus litorisediminis]